MFSVLLGTTYVQSFVEFVVELNWNDRPVCEHSCGRLSVTIMI